MIIGPATHRVVHNRLGNSICPVIATFDSKMTNYHSKRVVQPKPRLETGQLDEIAYEMLEKFKKRNNSYPDYVTRLS